MKRQLKRMTDHVTGTIASACDIKHTEEGRHVQVRLPFADISAQVKPKFRKKQDSVLELQADYPTKDNMRHEDYKKASEFAQRCMKVVMMLMTTRGIKVRPKAMHLISPHVRFHFDIDDASRLVENKEQLEDIIDTMLTQPHTKIKIKDSNEMCVILSHGTFNVAHLNAVTPKHPFAIGVNIISTDEIALNPTQHSITLISGMSGTGKTRLLHRIVDSIQKNIDDYEINIIDIKGFESQKLNENMNTTVMHEPEDIQQFMMQLTGIQTNDDTFKNIMDERSEIMRKAKCTSIRQYNALSSEIKQQRQLPDKLTHIFVFIDNFVNLSHEINISETLMHVGQKGRALGIHFVIASTRVSADIIPSTVKANITARLSFKQIDPNNSTIAIFENGAEKLMNYGHFLMRTSDGELTEGHTF